MVITNKAMVRLISAPTPFRPKVVDVISVAKIILHIPLPMALKSSINTRQEYRAPKRAPAISLKGLARSLSRIDSALRIVMFMAKLRKNSTSMYIVGIFSTPFQVVRLIVAQGQGRIL